jgi:hypothetical protein
MRQFATPTQPIQIPHLFDQIRRQHQRRQIRQRIRDPAIDILNAVPRAQQRVQSRRQGEIAQRRDIIVREINGVLLPSDTEIFDRGDFVACFHARGGCLLSTMFSCSKDSSVVYALFRRTS